MLPGLPRINLYNADIIQRKFILESFDAITINVTEKSNSFITVYISAYTDYINTQTIWSASGNYSQ